MKTQSPLQSNRIEIAIRINDRAIVCGLYWPRYHIRFLARRKIAILKRKWNNAIVQMAGLIVPLPQVTAV